MSGTSKNVLRETQKSMGKRGLGGRKRENMGGAPGETRQRKNLSWISNG